MKSDTEIKSDVESELKWDADIDATDVGVAVKDGVVTLSGFMRSCWQKWLAEVMPSGQAGSGVSPTTSKFACPVALTVRIPK